MEWGNVAEQHGHEVIHFTFAGHRSSARPTIIHELSPDDLAVANPHLEKANLRLKRRWPVRNLFTANLLRRNYYQIAEAESLYAISSFEQGFVAGGTAWAVAMMLDRFTEGTAIPCYVFDQKKRTWTTWDGYGFLEIDQPPTPCGVWAGIGTRDLNEYGFQAIRGIWR